MNQLKPRIGRKVSEGLAACLSHENQVVFALDRDKKQDQKDRLEDLKSCLTFDPTDVALNGKEINDRDLRDILLNRDFTDGKKKHSSIEILDTRNKSNLI